MNLQINNNNIRLLDYFYILLEYLEYYCKHVLEF